MLHRLRWAILMGSMLMVIAQGVTAGIADNMFAELREAAMKNNAGKAAQLADRLRNYAIPSYVDYYRLKARLDQATETEVQGFLTRHAGSAIADRLRNDWLLVLGRRGDWAAFDRHHSQFVLKDDLQVKCYALLSASVKGSGVANEARKLLVDPRKYGEGCVALIRALAENGQFSQDDVWSQIRLAGENGRGALAERLAGLVGAPEGKVARAVDLPLLTLARGPQGGRIGHETFIIALGRLARSNHEQAAEFVLKHAIDKLSVQEQQLAWAQIALPASIHHARQAADYWRKAGNAPLSMEGHEWKARTALRAGDWKTLKQAILAMPAALRAEPTWIYWLGRAHAHEGDETEARRLYQTISAQHHFYGQLALEELGQRISIPPQAAPVTAQELAPMAAKPGFARALKFFEMNMRFEGLREWNWELRGMTDRELLAAAEYARQKNVLDRMVNASDRTRSEFDFTQRFPTPHRELMQDATQQRGLDMAWAYGLIRQESRFVTNAKSSAGASGLMQLMPKTAKWVARKIGMDGFRPGDVNDPKTNITLGTSYLKMVLDDLDGSQVLASAAYNAGPKRPKNWRATLPRTVEGAVFAETIPFAETRGYVKNVLSNATYYAVLFEQRPQSLKARLGSVSPKKNEGTVLP